MADYLRSIDPARHLVTSSFAIFVNDPSVWAAAGLDLTQLHFYSRTGPLVLFPDLARDVVDFSAARVRDYGRPVLFSELGVASSGPDETVQVDPEGIGVHDGLWAGAFGGGMGTAMPWWWDSVTAAEPDRYYPMFGSVAHFLHDVAFDRAGFVAATSRRAAGQDATCRPTSSSAPTGPCCGSRTTMCATTRRPPSSSPTSGSPSPT